LAAAEVLNQADVHFYGVNWIQHAPGGCIVDAYPTPSYYYTSWRYIYFNTYASPDASDTHSSSETFYQICKLAPPSQPPPPAPPQEYVPIGYIGRWQYETAFLNEYVYDFFEEYVLEATGQFRGKVSHWYDDRWSSTFYNNSYSGAYLQTTCAVEAEGSMTTKDLYWTQYDDRGFASVICAYETRNPETRHTVASVRFQSDAIYSVADLQARYAPGNCPDLAVAMTDGVAWMPEANSWTTLFPFNCIEDCLDFTCALAAPPPSPPWPPPWPPSAPFAPTNATASIYGLAIGIPVGVCLLGVAICSAIYWFKRRKQTLAANVPVGGTAPVQVEITAQPQVVTHSELLTNTARTARTASTDGHHATPQQIYVTVAEPESRTKTAQVASTDLRDGDAATSSTKEAREEGAVMEKAQPTSLAALLAACGLEHRAINFKDEGYTFEDLLSAIKQGGEDAAKSDLRELKLSLGERRQIITQLQSNTNSTSATRSKRWL
jgi:hypothetical protein